MEYVPFCDQSLQRHEQIVTDKHFSTSDGSMILVAFWQNKPTSQKPYMSRGKFCRVSLAEY
jgi:hypothetical protein